jgi:LacI family transcriptional regulator
MDPTSGITLKAIAERLGVSTTTVSRSLSGQAQRYRIGKQMEAKVRALAEEMGFSPNRFARGLRLKKTSTIGLIVPDISNPFFGAAARQISIGIGKHGYSMLLCDSQGDVALEQQALEVLRNWQVEGIIVCPVGQAYEHLAAVARAGVPLVLVDRFFPELRVPYVGADNATGAREATEYLIGQGHRRIACLQGLRGTMPNEERLRGYRDALTQHEIRFDAALVVGDGFTEESGYRATGRLLRELPDVTALLAFCNPGAMGAIRALTDADRKIPEEMSLVSFDETAYAAHLAAPLTTVAQPNAEMGDVAIRLLFDQLQSPGVEPPQGILLPTRLVVRRSVTNRA